MDWARTSPDSAALYAAKIFSDLSEELSDPRPFGANR